MDVSSLSGDWDDAGVEGTVSVRHLWSKGKRRMSLSRVSVSSIFTHLFTAAFFCSQKYKEGDEWVRQIKV